LIKFLQPDKRPGTAISGTNAWLLATQECGKPRTDFSFFSLTGCDQGSRAGFWKGMIRLSRPYLCPQFFMTEYFNIGKFVATFGLKGELVLKHTLGKKTSLKGLTAVFVEEKKESFLPWFIESTKIKNEEEIYIKIEGINTREQAVRLTQKQVWLPEADFKKYSSKSSPISFLGFEIVEEGKVLGKILEVIEQPHQVLCRIDLNGKEALIPLHEETIVRIDKKKGQVIVQLPEGLLEIYQ
jgi:16S rRNA processing protein RimM